ncbi:MAG: alanine--tRNA ligase [Candidatus Pacebacteria bacterium]|nr:alanine--tRNA ligase [Candidatus Paceibacterota bacterium]
MTSKYLRQEFLSFFEKRGHKIVPSSSLLPSDPSVLFTTAGMQQFKPYYLGEKSPYGSNVVSCQKCFRTSDVEEVGDESHLTFLEMLGNFSFGGYFKEEAIKSAYDFLFKELKLPLAEAVFTVFEGNENVPEDKESVEIWKKLGVPEDKIQKKGKEDNFWGPTGEEGPCGPTTEIHLKGIEVWNLVFNEYYQDKNKKLTPLSQRGVDTGMGLERLAMIAQGGNSVFETDLFSPIINEITGENEKAKRIIADHVKGSIFLIQEGVLPSNVERGYVLRRVLRRAIRYGKLLNLPKNFLIPLAQKAIEIYNDIYPELRSNESDIVTVIQNEEEKFEKTLEDGLKQFEKGLDAFELYTTYGFPLELTIELAKEKGIKIDVEGFNKKFKEHQEISRAGAEKKFVGGLADHSEKTIKYHTAAHLMLAALREVLGPEIYQKGSNITAERLRFDFNYPQKLSEEQIRKVEELVNQKIKEDLAVNCQEMTLKEAKEKGAMGVFEEKYGEKVKVYSIGEFSKEICGGPHVKMTSELGNFKITKEESSGAGIRRIRAVLE